MADGSLGSASGSIELDASKAMAALSQVGSGLQNLDRQSGQFGGGFSNFVNQNAQTLTTVGTTIAGLGTVMLGIFGVATHTMIGFEAQVSAVGSVTGATGDQLKALREEALRLGADTTFSASEAATAMEIMAKAGAPIEDILNGATESVLNLSAATGTNVPLSAETVATAMNVFGVSAETAADIIAQSANASSLDVNDWALAMKSAGPIAASLGIPIEELAGAMVILGDAGIKGETGATALRNILMGLADPAGAGATALQELGVATHDAQGNFRGLEAVTHDLAPAWDNLTQAQKLQLAQTVAGEQGAASFITMMDAQAEAVRNGSDAFDESEQRMKSTGTASEQAQARMDNLAGSIEQLKGTLETLAIEFTAGLAPAMRRVVDGLTNLLRKVLELPPGVKTAIAAVFGIVGALSLAGGSFLLLLPRIVATVQAFQAFKAMLGGIKLAALLTNPVGLAVLAVLALVAGAVLLYKHFQPFRDLVNRVGRAIADFVDGIGDLIEHFQDFRALGMDPVEAGLMALGAAFPSLRGLTVSLAAAWNGLTATFRALRDAGINPVSAALAALGSTIGGPIGSALRQAADLVQSLLDAFTRFRDLGLNPVSAALQALGAVFPAIDTLMDHLTGTVESLIGAFQAALAGDWSGMFDLLGAAARQAWDALQEGIRLLGQLALALGSVVVDIAGWVIGQIPNVWAWLRDTALPAMGAALVGIGTVAVNVAGWVAGKIDNVWEWLKATILGGGSSIGRGGAMAGGAVGGGSIDLGNVALTVAGWVKGAIANAFDAIKGWVLGETGGVLSLPNIAANITSWVEGVIDPIADDITSWVGEVSANIKTIGNVSSWSSILVPESGTTIANIRDAVGDLTVDGLVALLSVDLSLQTVNNITDAIDQAQARIQNFLIEAIKVTARVAFALLMAPLVGIGALVSAAGLNISAYLAGNPMEAKRLAVAFAAWFNRNKSTIGFTYAEIASWAIEKVVPGGSLVLKIPTLIELVWGGGDEGPTATGQDLSEFPVPGGTGPAVPQGWLLDLPKITVTTDAIEGPPIPESFRQDFGSRLTESLRTPTTSAMGATGAAIGQKVGEWMPIFSAGLAPLGPIATVSFGAVNTSAATQLGMALGSVIANTAGMSASTAANLGAMAATGVSRAASMAAGVTASLSGMRGTSVSTVSGMGSSVASSITTMGTTSAAQVLGMRLGIAASMLSMQSSATSAANSARTGVVAAFVSMAALSAQAVRGGMSLIPGIIASVGGSAAATAHNVGYMIGMGVAAGLYAALGAVQAAAAAIVNTAAMAMAAAAAIRSPSHRFREEIGRQLGAGVVVGMRDMLPAVAREGLALMDAASAPLGRFPSGALMPAGAGSGYGGGDTYITYAPTIADGAIRVTEAVSAAATAREVQRELMSTMQQGWANAGMGGMP